MAIDARCLGASNNSILEDDIDSNFYKGTGNLEWINRFKIKKADDWYLSAEMEKMDSLGILKAETQKNYWIASRNLEVGGFIVKQYVRYVNSDGEISNGYYLSGVASKDNGNTIYSNCQTYECGLRPLIVLKNDIKVERTGHIE